MVEKSKHWILVICCFFYSSILGQANAVNLIDNEGRLYCFHKSFYFENFVLDLHLDVCNTTQHWLEESTLSISSQQLQVIWTAKSKSF